MLLNNATLFILLYFTGFIFEFFITMNQINKTEIHRNYIYNELKLTKIELFIAVSIISAIWFVVEPYIHFMNSKGNPSSSEEERERARAYVRARK